MNSVDYSALTNAIDVSGVSAQLISVAGTLMGITITVLVIRKVVSLVRRG